MTLAELRSYPMHAIVPPQGKDSERYYYIVGEQGFRSEHLLTRELLEVAYAMATGAGTEVPPEPEER